MIDSHFEIAYVIFVSVESIIWDFYRVRVSTEGYIKIFDL